MSYLPELRDSLVKAAARQGALGGIERQRTRARRRPTVSGIATLLAAAIAIAVAVLALTIIPHGRHGSSSTAQGGGASNEAAARRLLGQLVLPAGAIETGLVRGVPADLWSPADSPPLAHRADVYRVWRLRQRPEQIIHFIQAHRPAGSQVGWGSESGSSTRGGPEQITNASVVLSYPVNDETTSWRELAIQVDALPGGGSALRADGEAARLIPRPAAERIPDGVDRVEITATNRTAGHIPPPQFRAVTSPREIQALAAGFNSLPRSQPGTVGCVKGRGARIRVSFAFYGRSQATPLAVAVAGPCNTIQLTINGNPKPDLVFALAPGPSAQQIALSRTLLSVVPDLPKRRRVARRAVR